MTHAKQRRSEPKDVLGEALLPFLCRQDVLVTTSRPNRWMASALEPMLEASKTQRREAAHTWWFLKIGGPQVLVGSLLQMDNKLDDFGVPLFLRNAHALNPPTREKIFTGCPHVQRKWSEVVLFRMARAGMRGTCAQASQAHMRGRCAREKCGLIQHRWGLAAGTDDIPDMRRTSIASPY